MGCQLVGGVNPDELADCKARCVRIRAVVSFAVLTAAPCPGFLRPVSRHLDPVSPLSLPVFFSLLKLRPTVGFAFMEPHGEIGSVYL